MLFTVAFDAINRWPTGNCVFCALMAAPTVCMDVTAVCADDSDSFGLVNYGLSECEYHVCFLQRRTLVFFKYQCKLGVLAPRTSTLASHFFALTSY